MRLTPWLAAVVSLVGVASTAHAQVRAARPSDDGVWGRFGSDVVASLGASAGVALGDPLARERSAAPEPTFALDLEFRVRIVDSAGIVLAPEWRPEGASRFGIALDVRPVFLTRFLFGGTTRDRYWDLLFDSIGVELGMSVLAPDGRVGVAWLLGLGLELPLYVPEAITGAVALRLAARYTSAGPRDAWGPGNGVDEWSLLGGLLVRFHASVGLANWEPPRYRERDPE